MLRRAGTSSYKEAEDLFSEVYKQKHEAGEDDALVLEALQELVVLLVAQGEQRYQEAEERCAKLIEARKRPGEAADKLVFALGQQVRVSPSRPPLSQCAGQLPRNPLVSGEPAHQAEQAAGEGAK